MLKQLSGGKMENIGEVLDGVAALFWPLLILILIVKFSKPIGDIIRSAVRRKFSIKVGNNEVTMEEASEQQRRMINDLQENVVGLQKRIESKNISTEDDQELLPEKNNIISVERILWVDDYPSNNATIIAHMSELGVDVVAALSTKEGLRKFNSNKYNTIISDMSRREGGKNNPSAGVDLTAAIREIDKDIPIFIFCSRRGKERAGKDALKAGANGVMTSGVRLLNMLSRSGKFGKF